MDDTAPRPVGPAPRSVDAVTGSATEPGSGDSVASFARDLHALRASVGAPSYARLARRSGVPRSTLHDGLRGERLPSQETVTAVVRALGGDEEVWAARWAQLRLDYELGHDSVATPNDRPATPLAPRPDGNPDTPGTDEGASPALDAARPPARDAGTSARRRRRTAGWWRPWPRYWWPAAAPRCGWSAPPATPGSSTG